MKKLIRKFKRYFSKNKKDAIILAISALLLIVGIFKIGLIRSVLLVGFLDFIIIGIPKIFKFGKKKTKKEKKKMLIIILSIVIVGLLCVTAFFTYIVISAPKFDPENLYAKESSILYDSNGEIFAKLGAEKREKITYNDLPQVLIDAIIATEDSKFYKHNGFDAARFLKASFTQLLGKGGGGASTITMQIAKNAYTSKTSSGFEGIKRKFTDIYLAVFKIEKTYTKEEILEFYVNSYYMGAGAYGVEQACQTYFGKSVKDINLTEAALIAGLFKGGYAYDPFINPEDSEARRNTVLYLMKRHGYITEEEKEAAKSYKVTDLVNGKTSNAKKSNYQDFIDTVVSEVKEKTGENPYAVPMEIYTTMNKGKQEYVASVFSGENFKWENDVVQSGATIIDTNTGAIVAIGAGRNRKGEGTYNYATMIKRQIGSTAKPLYDYGPAIEYNNFSPATVLVDEPYSYSNGGSLNNWDRKYTGYTTARVALKDSRNVPALKTFKSVSNKNIKTFVTSLGLSPELSNGIIHEAHSIGGYNGESSMTMAAAYSAFANGGYYTKPYSFTKVVYRETKEEYNNKHTTNKVMSEETAYLITSILIDSSAHTHNTTNINGITFASKTGTTNFNSETKDKFNLPSSAINDLWVSGYSKDYALAVWYGYDSINKDYVTKNGNSQHAKLFRAIAKGVFSGTKEFTKPSGIIELEIETGNSEVLLPSAYTPASLRKVEYFKAGTEPTETSTRFAQLNNVTNLNSSITNDTVNISWDPITTPDAISESSLRSKFSSIFSDESYLNSFINERIQYNNSYIGHVTYNVYKQDNNGNLTLLGNTASTNYSTTVSSNATTTKYIVKSVYSIFKDNMSTGTTTTVINNNPIFNGVDDGNGENNEDPNPTDNTDNNN